MRSGVYVFVGVEAFTGSAAGPGAPVGELVRWHAPSVRIEMEKAAYARGS
ncbi:hypothetical protein [Streptomyces sp. NPDC046942]